MSIIQVLQKFSNLEIEQILSFVIKKPKEFLYMNPKHRLTPTQTDRLIRMVKRRQAGEPLAYILGYKDFCGLRFIVNKNVLVPRPETELIVERVISTVIPGECIRVEESLKSGLYNKPIKILKFKGSLHSSAALVGRDDKVKILDIGTGSGCIAVSIAMQFESRNQKLEISASDISPTALLVAKHNAKTHGAKIKFYKSDLLKNIKPDFDIIIANLPYGWAEWKNNTTQVSVGLKFEPKQALFTKERGLYEIRQLLEQMAIKKNQPKYIFLEFDPRQKVELQKLVKKILPNFKPIFYKDFRGLWRILELSCK